MTDHQTYSEGDRIPITIEEELKNSYLDYAMSVIIGRALPDVRDGLKPVHRRILYGMWEAGNTAGKPYKKSARIVGDVMGKYHPHGDAAIYDTAVRMAQDFSMRYTLVDGQGNFGSVDGDAPAAMRYTEIRLTRLSEELLGDDIGRETVDWTENYDGSLVEPVVLPAQFPNLLVNGSSGIAVGMATNIPPHNLREIVDATVALIRTPSLSDRELIEIVPGPDFPTAGFIHGRSGIVDAYTTGRGIVQVRARVVVEEGEKKKRAALVVTELPYQVNKARLTEHIASLVQAKRLEGISDLRDESDRDGIRLVIELKREAIPEVVLNNLYKLTQLQTTFGIILLAVVGNQPRVFTLRELIGHFIDHRKEVVIRRTRFELARARERAHILDGLVIALDNLDAVIELIRGAADPPAAAAGLMGEFSLSELQAQAILEMRLQRLTGLERSKIVDEHREVLARIAHLEAVLASEAMVLDIIVEELLAIRSRYGDDRRTVIIADPSEISVEDLIAEEDMVITVSRGGYIKRSALAAYRAQRRGGRGRRGMSIKAEDEVEKLFVASTHAVMLFFTTAGKVFARKVHELPDVGPGGRGRALVNLLQLDSDERVAALLAVRDFAEHEDAFLLFATRLGKVKRTALAEYANIRANGLRAVAINPGDDLLSVHLTDGSRHVFMGTHRGMGIRFEEGEARPMGRVSAGVRGINLREGDWVEEVATVDPSGENDILVVTDLGFGKRTPVADFRIQQRGGHGLKLIQLTSKNGTVAGIRHVDESDQILLLTEGGILIRMNVSEIRRSGRATQGVRVIRLDEGDRVVSLAKLAEDDTADGEEPEADDSQLSDADLPADA
ncbi:MAG TPA: DNA gyrase subunit A [Thermoanaerobaculales bacterium]|nr:DNA gyrase subunit A [Thermoanaerobaculales bacterium]HPA80945.1 DNA gyrase subunit A [Thermoanaerobaculales bacterium]HQL31230.1 DNA gyrase subunit A [Thermoanaerobaculales bacterium]HQP44669.1 DNA gyrase subunit A [Thermoanaerobaculales bacterium]